MTNSVTVAVVIPFYNGSSFIRRAVESVLAQSRPVDEVVIVNDGSSPTETAFIEDFAAESGLRLVHQANAGQSAARNAGARQTAASHLCFLDQDDYFSPNHVEVLHAALTETPEDMPDYVYGDADRVDLTGEMLRPRIATALSHHPKTSLKDFVSADAFILPSASMISKHLFESVGGFEPGLRGYEDDDFFVRAFIAGFTGRFVNESVLCWTLNLDSSSHSPLMAESRLIYMERLTAMLSVRSPEEQKLLPAVVYPRFLMSFAFDLLYQRSLGSTSPRAEELFIAADRIAQPTNADLPAGTRRIVTAVRMFAKLSVRVQIPMTRVILSRPMTKVRLVVTALSRDRTRPH